ncbi:MAG: hypothetical protein K2I70_05870 [Bacilli bacterium]|nr:hypothetical protein [Bacilli bacterium]
MNLNKLNKCIQRKNIYFEIGSSEFDCYTNYQKMEIMKFVRSLDVDSWDREDILNLIKNEKFKKNIDSLIYIFECQKWEGKGIDLGLLANMLFSKIIWGVRNGEKVEIYLAMQMLQEYAENGSNISKEDVFKLADDLISPKLDCFFLPAIKLSLFNCTILSTQMGYDLGNKVLHLFELCDRRNSLGYARVYDLGDKKMDRELRKRFHSQSVNNLTTSFDEISSFEVLEKVYFGVFDEHPVVKELIEKVYSNYEKYKIDEDLLDYSLDAFDEAINLFKVLNEEIKKIDEPSSGTPNVLLK